MPGDQNRAFHYALLASLLLHGMTLIALQPRSALRPPTTASPPLEARLVEPPVPVVQPPAPPPPPVAAAPRPSKPAPPKPKARPAPKPAPVEEPAASVEPATPAPPLDPRPVEPEAPAAPPVLAAPAAPAAPPAPPAAPAPEALDPGLIAQYRVQLLNAAPRYKAYPAAARDNNWEGIVVLRMVVAPSGGVASLTVQKSSGYRILDQQALEMFRKASAAVPVPAGLRGREFAVEQLAVNYYFQVKD